MACRHSPGASSVDRTHRASIVVERVVVHGAGTGEATAGSPLATRQAKHTFLFFALQYDTPNCEGLASLGDVLYASPL